MAIRALLDTSVLVPIRTRSALLASARAGAFVAVWSPWIIAELNRVLTWRWLERTGGALSPSNQRACSNAANAMMALLLDAFVLVDPTGGDARADWLTDPFDFPIWAAARAGAVDCVVSDNVRDFPPADARGLYVWEGVEYLTSPAFLARLDEVG